MLSADITNLEPINEGLESHDTLLPKGVAVNPLGHMNPRYYGDNSELSVSLLFFLLGFFHHLLWLPAFILYRNSANRTARTLANISCALFSCFLCFDVFCCGCVLTLAFFGASISFLVNATEEATG